MLFWIHIHLLLPEVETLRLDVRKDLCSVSSSVSQSQDCTLSLVCSMSEEGCCVHRLTWVLEEEPRVYTTELSQDQDQKTGSHP